MDTRTRMIEHDLKPRGINDPRVLNAFSEVNREDFVPENLKSRAYEDNPLPIGQGQTISQPYIVALTVQALDIEETDTVLDIGTGSGYAAAILSKLCSRVITVETIPELAQTAQQRLSDLGFDNIEAVAADGTLGYPAEAPYDAIAVGAAAPDVPSSLEEQLAPEGSMVIPVGDTSQQLLLVKKDEQGRIIEKKNICNCIFVPLVGEEGF